MTDENKNTEKEYEHIYKLLFDLPCTPGEFTRELVEEKKCGAADAYIVLPMIFPKDQENIPQMDFLSVDGRTGGEGLPIDDIIAAWMMLAKKIRNSEDLLSSEQKELFDNSLKIIETYLKNQFKKKKEDHGDTEIGKVKD